MKTINAKNWNSNVPKRFTGLVVWPDGFTTYYENGYDKYVVYNPCSDFIHNREIETLLSNSSNPDYTLDYLRALNLV